MTRLQPHLVIALAALAAVLVSAAHSSSQSATARHKFDWPQFRFNDDHTGFNDTESTITAGNVGSLSEAWRALMPGSNLGGIYGSSPTVAEGTVYIGTRDGTLYAFPARGCGNAVCTKPLWKSSYLAEIVGTPAVANGIVYIGSQTNADSNDGKLNAFSTAGCGQAVCEPLWQGDAGSESALGSPTVSNGFVFLATYSGRLYVFNAEGCGKSLCQPLWTAKVGKQAVSTPTVHDGIVYVEGDVHCPSSFCTDTRLSAFDAAGCGSAECKPLWTGHLKGYSSDGVAPAVWNDKVYALSGKRLAVFSADGCGAAKCSALFEASDHGQFFGGSPAIADGHVFINTCHRPPGQQFSVCGVGVYPADGCGNPECDLLYFLYGPGEQANGSSSPAIANGLVFSTKNTGQLFAWSISDCGADLCSPLWEADLPDFLANSSPTVVNGEVYIGNSQEGSGQTDGLLLAYKLPAGPSVPPLNRGKPKS